MSPIKCFGMNRNRRHLKKALTVQPIVKMTDLSKPILQVDASNEGLGAVVSQNNDGKKKPCCVSKQKIEVEGEIICN